MSKLNDNSITDQQSSSKVSETASETQQISEAEFIRWAFRKAEQIRQNPDSWAELDSKRAAEFAESLLVS